MEKHEYKELEDWVKKNECYPFEDSMGNLCITVQSKYESYGGEREARLNEAKEYGIDRLIKFYGKSYLSDVNDLSQLELNTLPTPTELYDAAEVADSFISLRLCARMKVLVKIPKEAFDKHTVNQPYCDINKPLGYLSAFISIENYERDIDYVTTSMEDFLPKMVKADKYMTNINIVTEIERLRDVKNVISRYFNLNSVTAAAIKEEECEPDKQSQMEIGFSYDYKPAFALIDGNKHTIGYDCFLEESLLNHPTTANYLIQLGNMSNALTKQLSLDFDIFQFLAQHTYPIPVIETKSKSLDGIKKYDANGNLFSFANIAKLITLDLDKKSCKTDENEKREREVDFNADTKLNIAETVRQSKEFVGNMKLSSKGSEDLKKTGSSIAGAFKDPGSAIDKIYNDVLIRLDFNCILEESLKCSLEAAITRLGEAAFDDPDLSEFFNADGVIEVFGRGGCGSEDDCEKELQLKVGLPIFKGIKIPSNFPTTDYVAAAIDAALKQLYNVLIDAIVSFITAIFELMCKTVSSLPDFPAIGSMLGEGFTSWLSDTIGIDVSKLSDEQAWADAALSAGGTGLMGAVGNLVSKTAGSTDSNGDWVWGGSATAAFSGTGISLDLPNPSTGLVEQVFVSPELIYQTMSAVKKGTEDLEEALTPGEQKSYYKGSAPEDVEDFAFGCLNRGNPDVFQNREDATDLFTALGEIVNVENLEIAGVTPITITNSCQLGDGTSQDMMAKHHLTSKDPLLSDSEIEELLSKEKNRLIEKIKKIHKLLKEFQDGTIFPSFPSLFGSEDSLIPTPPPVISDAMKSAASGMYSSAINNLNATIIQYPEVWQAVFENEVNDTIVNLDDLYSDSQAAFSIDKEGDIVVMGYELPEELPLIIEPEEYFEVLEGSTMTDGWWYYGVGVDLGSYTSEVNSRTDSDHYPLFRDMLDVLGLKEYEASDRADIIDEINKIDEELRDLLQGRWAETWSDIKDFFSAKWADKLEWKDLNLFRANVKNKLQGEVDNILSQLGETLEDWRGYDEACREIIWDSSLPIYDLDGGKLNDKDDKKDFQKVVDAYDIVEPLYLKGKAALVVMDIANFLEEWDDENGSDFEDMKGGDEYDDKNRTVSPKPELIDGSYEKPIGKVTLVYNITEIMTDEKKLDLAALVGDGDPDNITAMAHITFKTDFTKRNEFYVKASFRILKAGEEILVEPVRDGTWTKTLTTFERKGVRLVSTSNTNSEVLDNLSDASTHSGGSLVNIFAAISNGGNSDYEVVASNKITTNIGNYKIANDLMISLGRKEARSNLLEEKYSFNTVGFEYTLADWFSSAGAMRSTTAVSAGKYVELVIETGGSEEMGEIYALDYMLKMQAILNDMRDRVMTSQYTNVENIQEMIDSYAKADAIKYKDLTKWAEGHVSEVLKIQQLDEMCDTLSPNGRTAASMGVRMLAREFILESAFTSLQVFDTFNTGFMESEAFRQTIFDNIKTEMKKYSNSFEDTIDNDIFSDIKDAAVKYYEYRSLLGEEVEISSSSRTLVSIIGEEISEIRKNIISSLKLSESGDWDDFVLDEILPAAGFNVDENYDAEGGYYFLNVEVFNTTEGTIALFSSQCVGTADEGSKEGGDTNVCGDIEDVVVSGKYLTVRQQLFDNEEYKEFINQIFSLKGLVTQLSVYQSSALSDVAVFSGTSEDGKNLFDIFAETKLSTLQVMLASIHGAKETTYIDPFLEKLKT